MSDSLDELRADLARALAVHLAVICVKSNPVPTLDLVEAVNRATEDWRVSRKDYPHRDDHPLSEVRYGHALTATLPFKPETEAETVDREAWESARSWAARAWMIDFDPAAAARGDYTNTDDDPGPPPERVGANQLIQQGLWWRMRESRNPEDKTTVAVRVADMDHDHRLSLLGFLRRNAKAYKEREDWAYASGPQPSGDMACDAFEAECDRQWSMGAHEWLEDQPLICTLVYWTTPYGEAPLTWRPMDEAPHDGTTIAVRWPDSGPLDEPDRAYWLAPHYAWCLEHGSELFDSDSFAQWRELYPYEQPIPVPSADFEDEESQ